MAQRTPELRNKIISTARGIFARFGLHKTTIDEIAKALRMGKSSLYYYFTNKEDLFKAVIDQELDLFRTQLNKAVNEAPTPQGKLKAFGLCRMQYLRKLENAWSAVKENHLDHYGFVKETRDGHDRYEIELVGSILKEGVDGGIFSVENPELAGRMIIMALKGLEQEWTLQGEAMDIERTIDRLLHVLLNGIMKK
jgi:AcrR family transcriptional regulator